MPYIRELVARAVEENDIQYIRIPHKILDQYETQLFTFIEDFYKSKHVVPDKQTILNKFKEINKSFFEDFNTRYDAKTMREETVKERIVERRRTLAEQHFVEDQITYSQFQQEIKELDAIGHDVESAIVLASEMDDNFDWLTTGYVETPLREMNNIYSGGLGYGDLSLMAGGTGTGKTYFLTFLIMYALISGKRVIINPSEMSKTGYWQRFVSWSTGKSWSDWLKELRSKDNKVSSKALENFKIAHRFLKNEFSDKLIFTNKNFGSVRDFDAAVTTVYDRFGSLDLFITDTVQDIETNNKFSGAKSFNDSAMQTSKELRNWVTESNSAGKMFHFITTAQTVKSAQSSSTISLSDIGGSKRVQEDSTYIMALTNKTDNTRQGTPLKVRHGAKAGCFNYAFDWHTMTFIEVLQDDIEGDTYNLKEYFRIPLLS